MTARKVSGQGNEALIYVADRGNNRVVQLRQQENLNIEWEAVLRFPGPSGGTIKDMYGYSGSGLEDIEVDDKDVASGVFILDSRRNLIIHTDFFLEDILEEYPALLYVGNKHHDIEVSTGQLGVLSPYTDRTGAELLQFRGSIVKFEVSPNPFNNVTEWTLANITLTSYGTLNVWVEDENTTFIDSLVSNALVSAGVEYAIWDGRDQYDNLVTDSLYVIKAKFDDYSWIHTDLKAVTVKVKQDEYMKVVTEGHEFIAYPDWSPDGSELLYSAGGSSMGSYVAIYKISATGGTPVPLTATDDGKFLHPSWSFDGENCTSSST